MRRPEIAESSGAERIVIFRPRARDKDVSRSCTSPLDGMISMAARIALRTSGEFLVRSNIDHFRHVWMAPRTACTIDFRAALASGVGKSGYTWSCPGDS